MGMYPSPKAILKSPELLDKIVEQLHTTIINTTIIQESPLIDQIKTKLDTIQEGAQVNPDMAPIQAAINTASDSVNSLTSEVNTHKSDNTNPHATTKEQTGLRVEKGTVQFLNESQKNILFAPGYFTSDPEVPLTLIDPDLTPPIRINVSKDGFTIKLKTRATLKIGYVATQIV